MKISLHTAILCIFLGMLSPHRAFFQKQPPHSPSEGPLITRVLGSPLATKININRISAWYTANGEQERTPQTGNSGLHFPRGTATVVYCAGLLWGGKFRDGVTPIIRVNGQAYNNGTKPGAILGIRTGTAEYTLAPDVRIWRIRKDYQISDLRLDAAEIFLRDPRAVTFTQIAAVREQYRQDWAEWPWQKGAPFYDNGYRNAQGQLVGANNGVLDWGEDVNRNGILDPGEDQNNNGLLDAEAPGIANADQVIWFVCNDIDVAQPWQCPTSGIEEQTTIWAYASEPFQDIVFKRFRILYKGTAESADTAWIDSMYIAHWSDTDLGTYTDDLAGCDTSLQIGYTYNGQPIDNSYDRYNLPPPAFGYCWIQGPLVQTNNLSDTANAGFRRILGAKNLLMTSFFAHVAGSDIASDPPFYLQGALMWYQAFRGLPFRPVGPPDPSPWRDHQGNVTTFIFSGDRVSMMGWLDGNIPGHTGDARITGGPGDRRFAMISGPFTMALGDTQEVIVAVVGGLGSDYIQSITELRNAARTAHAMYNSRLFTLSFPRFSVSSAFSNQSQAIVTIIADGRPAVTTSMKGTLKRPDNTVVATFDLLDDGNHGDGLPNDGIFGNSVTTPIDSLPLHLESVVVTAQNDTVTLGTVQNNIPIAGKVTVGGPFLFSDNLNNDGRVQPGENIRYGFSVTNSTSFTLRGIRVEAINEKDGKVVYKPNLAPGGQATVTYNRLDPSSYFSAEVPTTYKDTAYWIALVVSDTNGNLWHDTLRFAVQQWPRGVDTVSIVQTTGEEKGRFEIVLVDPLAMKKHLYAIRGPSTFSENSYPAITLKDSTDGRILLSDVAIPDSVGHEFPVTDGFKILRGSFDPRYGMVGDSGLHPWSYFQGNGMGLEGYQGAIGLAWGTWLSSSTVTPDRIRNVLIKFAATQPNTGNLVNANDTTASFAYRYLRNASLPPAQPSFTQFILSTGPGYPYQDFRKIPLAAYDLESNPPRRLALGFLENNVTAGLVDGKYWPPTLSVGIANTDTAGTHEFFFIFDAPYRTTPETTFQTDISTTRLPIVWWGTPTRSASAFNSSMSFTIIAKRGIGPDDLWTFRARLDQIVPPTYHLLQNYPNPFNPTTTIEYEVPFDSKVTVRVYNILGQEVRTLVDEIQRARYHTTQWDGRDKKNIPVASGVYFYRITATSITEGGISYVSTKKMLLLR